jgi:hypothetical protein
MSLTGRLAGDVFGCCCKDKDAKGRRGREEGNDETRLDELVFARMPTCKASGEETEGLGHQPGVNAVKVTVAGRHRKASARVYDGLVCSGIHP